MKRRRTYRLRARAEHQARTRQRIATAAMELHERVGPGRTSIAAIAERAGVQRLTVYRHFPDELSLLRACGGQYRALHPPPAIEDWRAIGRAELRLATGLRALYRHFRETEAMWANVLRDVEDSETVRQAAEPRFAYLREAVAVLAEGWGGAGALAVRHACDFGAWRSLARMGLDEDDCAALMVTFVRAASRSR
jgi:AcrR family transcriptional regulator